MRNDGVEGSGNDSVVTSGRGTCSGYVRCRAACRVGVVVVVVVWYEPGQAGSK